ncbi:MAG: Glu/Leu/Phe/Val dehydrogenase dimerization domain-containing protein [bacterium]|nr:Glu/Leu/Phe/Val dehydrogenase dimerization domain-containing protein [bacterium]
MEQDVIQSLPEYDEHKNVSFLRDDKTNMRAFVAIHRKNGDMPSFGATRFWKYDNETEALRDALRLSCLMSYKAALAGLPCGGAKGVIFHQEDSAGQGRTRILESYAKQISSLKDSFITGTDVGVLQSDLFVMKRYAQNIVGFNDNSTKFTALGVVHGIQCAVERAFRSSSVKGRTFAIQGLGKIGAAVLEAIAPEAGDVYVADTDADKVASAKRAHKNVVEVPPDEIHRQKVDVFCPCAMGNALNTNNVAELSCSVIAGGANNQIENEVVGDILQRMGILYAPDYVINAGGLIAVYDEYEHPDSYEEERVRHKVLTIEDRLGHIFDESEKHGKPTHRIANELAEQTFNAYA